MRSKIGYQDMILEDFENVLTLIAAILGLLGCLFRYIKTPKRGYFLLIIFFLSNYLSDYYWTIYTLAMRSNPTVSEFLAYLGWNVGYLVLLITVLHMRSGNSAEYFHPHHAYPCPYKRMPVLSVYQFRRAVQ